MNPQLYPGIFINPSVLKNTSPQFRERLYKSVQQMESQYRTTQMPFAVEVKATDKGVVIEAAKRKRNLVGIGQVLIDNSKKITGHFQEAFHRACVNLKKQKEAR
jgi:hypothetical protein